MNKTNIMVCVTQQKTCERLILNGYKLAEATKGKLYVIHVVNEKDKFLNNVDDGEALEYLFRVSKKAGADLTVLRSKDVIQAIINFAKDNNITHMILGTTPKENNSKESNFALKLQESLPNVEFIII
ncbi:universal stress protein family protein [Keratinibaculum paraultunense]|uniref:Universal stress protein family protein n=1 Tax=Keratinibaculum paraultunense TaxID=1278232 RepID=A0A4R3KZY3_9FIRM|nr:MULTISPECIES: universal stress protein [Bacillota]MBU5455477.1 universal stress protein [Caproiciproducens sp. MSJ-32]QQY80447.1 universal stress protein [Keratinibaculum paraultunense]TCS91165.1 universal stress protein family protein [Keratinibaculum paraultunense]